MDSLPTSDLRSTYAAPVQRLLSIGEAIRCEPRDWPDYLKEFALGPEHIDELIRVACDAALHQADSDSSEVWAPVHAWRALAQLRAETSIPPLVDFLTTSEDDDAAADELPVVFGMIGPAAIPHCSGVLSDGANSLFSLLTAVEAVKEIADQHPRCRAECVRILARTLESPAHGNPLVSGCAVSALIDLRAVEAIGAIREAFRRKSVDISVAGDVEDVEIELELRLHRSTPAPRYMMVPADWSSPGDGGLDQRRVRIPPRHKEVGRNDPCPCGSGKKYKKCCLI